MTCLEVERRNVGSWDLFLLMIPDMVCLARLLSFLRPPPSDQSLPRWSQMCGQAGTHVRSRLKPSWTNLAFWDETACVESKGSKYQQLYTLTNVMRRLPACVSSSALFSRTSTSGRFLSRTNSCVSLTHTQTCIRRIGVTFRILSIMPL